MLKFLIFIVAAAAFGYYAYLEFDTTFGYPPGQDKACTAEAKICPDGSVVGRMGPNCTFPACPE